MHGNEKQFPEKRSRLERLLGALGLGWLVRRRRGSGSAAFTSAFVALCAKMAKSDGVAVASEWEAFERLIDVAPSEAARVKRVYDRAKVDAAGALAYAERIAAVLGNDPNTKREVIECLLYVACADGLVHPAEDAFLRQVATAFGIGEREYRSIRSLFVHDEDSPYEILGLQPSATDAEIKARYRKLAAENHPDRLMAAGAPPALIKTATAKLASINAAHEAIVKERERKA